MRVRSVNLNFSTREAGPVLHGLIVTIGLILVVEVLARAIPQFRSTAPILLLAIVYTAFVAGMKAGLLIALLLIGYGTLHFSNDSLFRYTADGGARLAILAISGPLVGLMVGLLKQRTDRLTDLALARQRSYTASLLATMQDGLILRDREGKIVEVNDSLCRLTGFSRDELLNRSPPYPFWPPDTHQESGAGGYRRFMTGENVELDLTFCRKGGECFPVMVTSSSSDDNGNSAGGLIVTTVKDITERKGHERRMTAQYAVARRLAESVSLRDAAPGILQSLCEAMGWTFAALWLVDADAGLLRCAHTFHANNVRPSNFEKVKWSRTFKLGQGLPGRVWESSEPVWVDDVSSDPNFPSLSPVEKAQLHSAVGFPIRVDRDVIGVIEFFHRHIRPPDADLRQLMDSVASQIGQFVQRKRADEALRHRVADLAHATRALRRTNEELDQFAYITSHDLKAPLRGIANLSTWIEEDMGESFTDEGRQQMELLRGRVRRMENLIDGILQYSRIGRVAGKFEEVDVAILLADVIDMLDVPKAFTIEVAPGMPRFHTDKLRLQQVLLNLIDNAIKHHDRPESGHLWITATDDGGANYEFAVRDDGPGIPPQYHERIFVIFQTLVARDKVEGTGVGLSLVKKTVEHLGGTVRVASPLTPDGRGAEFTFSWPKNLSQGA